MPANTAPIFTAYGLIGEGVQLKTAANDYTGTTVNTKEVFAGGDTNGAFIERLRFKAIGTNSQTVARIYINSGGINTQFGASAPTMGASSTTTTTGALTPGTYYAKLVAIGPGGSRSLISTEVSQVVPANGLATNTVTFNWTAVVGAVSYELYVADATGAQLRFFEINAPATSFQLTTNWQLGKYKDPAIGNMQLYGEVTLPGTTIIATAATPDIDYMMNIALPPGYEVYVGLGAIAAAGWNVCAIGGIY
jgi:hypothetical protein